MTAVDVAFASLQATVNSLVKVPLRRTTSDLTASRLIGQLATETTALGAAISASEPPPVGGTRNWAFFDSPGNDASFWQHLNSGWSAQPIDGLHVYTADNNSWWAGNGVSWSPPPKAILTTIAYGDASSVVDMGKAARGDYNAQWLSWLKANAANTPAPVVAARIWQEINGNWMPWSVNMTGGTSIDGTKNGMPWPKATIIAAWRNMATQVRTAFPKAVIEWNLSAGMGWPGQPGDGSGFDLYPGDDLVEVLGIDVYEMGQDFATTQSGAGVNLTNLAAFAVAHNKLLAVSETASANCDGTYLTDWATWLDNQGSRAAYFAWYEANNAPNSNILNVTSGQPGACPATSLQAAWNASSAGQKAFGGAWLK